MKKDLESKIKEQDAIIKKQEQTIDKLNQQMELRKRFAPGRPDGREVCRPHAVLPSNREAEKGRNKSSTTDGERLVPGYR